MRHARVLLTVLVLVGCREAPLRLGTGNADLGRSLLEVWNSNDAGPVVLDTSAQVTGSFNTIVSLTHPATIDLGVVQNDYRIAINLDSSGWQSGTSYVRSVWPLYSQVLFVLCRAGEEGRSLAELVRGRQVGVASGGSGSRQLVRALLEHHGLDSSAYRVSQCSYEALHPSDTVDVAFVLRSFVDEQLRSWVHDPRYRLVSLDTPRYGERSSVVDGFCLNYPLARPYFLPRGAMGQQPSAPVLTLAVDAVLVCRPELPADRVSALVEALHEHRSQLVSANPAYQDLPISLEGRSLQYPLHEGVQQYLERDKPTFFERYAETIGLLITVLSLGYAGLVTVTQTRKRRRKNRIDTYYTIVVDLEQRAPQLNSTAEVLTELGRLDQTRHKALEELAAERLDADASFVILLDLARSAEAALRRRLSALEAVADD